MRTEAEKQNRRDMTVLVAAAFVLALYWLATHGDSFWTFVSELLGG